MSICSIGEDSALRLTSPASRRPDMAVVATTAASTAAIAVDDGANVNDAAIRGKEAGEAAAAGNPTKLTVDSSPLTQLMKYIPTETIVLYVAILAALGDIAAPPNGTIADADFTSRWVWTGIMLAVTVALTVGLSYRSQMNMNNDGRFMVPIFDVIAAGAAFLVWAFSLPSTPLRDIAGYDYSAWNSVIILAGTVIIAVVAYVLGKAVTWQKVVDP